MKPENTRLAFIIVLTIINTFSSIINVNQAKYLCKFTALEVISNNFISRQIIFSNFKLHNIESTLKS